MASIAAKLERYLTRMRTMVDESQRRRKV